MGSPTCPTCGKDADFVETFHGARSCYHPFHATPTPPAPADARPMVVGGAFVKFDKEK